MIYKGTTFSRNGSIKSSFRAQFKQFLSKVTPTYNKKERFLGKIRYLCQQIRRRWNRNSTITLWTCIRCGSFASGKVRRLLTARGDQLEREGDPARWSAFVTERRFRTLPFADYLPCLVEILLLVLFWELLAPNPSVFFRY